MKTRKFIAVLSALILLGMQNLPARALTVSEIPESGILSEVQPLPEAFTVQTDTMTFEGYVDYHYVALVKCDTSLTSVEIPAEVTDSETGTTYPVGYVSTEAFNDCTNLQEITVSENQKKYTSIDGILCSADGSELIYYPVAKSPELVTVPDGIQKIGWYAFRHHPAKAIILPDSCTSVNSGAFGESLEKIHFGKSFRGFSSDAFLSCKNLRTITISEDNASFTVENNILYSRDKRKLYLYAPQNTETSYTVPETVTEISSYALNNCEALEEIILPEGITSIRDNFNQCTNLKTLTIPEGVTSLSYAGNDCTNLETLYLPSTLTYVYKIFNRCGLKDVYFNNTQDYWYNMANVRSTAVLTYPTMHFSDDDAYIKLNENGIDYRIYPDKAVVMGCDKELTEIHIPEQVQNVPVTEIHQEAFRNYETLKSAEIPETVTSIGTGAFYQSGLESVNLPENLTELGRSAFYGTNLSEITIPDGITELNNGMFCDCKNLKSVALPEHLKIIGASAFTGCAMETITLPETLKCIKWNAFAECSALKEITLPESVSQIEESAFRSCYSLKSITFLNSNCEIYDRQDTICNIYSEIELPPDGCIIDIEMLTEFSGVIRSYENSTAQSYAEKYHYTFESISESAELLPGDADGSGKADILDVIIINKAVLGKEKLTDEQLKAIDFNNNGKPDAEDALILMKKIVGLI